MKTKSILLIGLLAMASCQSQHDIDYVKRSPNILGMYTHSNLGMVDFLDSISNVGYTSSWKSFEPSFGFPPSVRIVQLTINKSDSILIVQFTYDRATNATDLHEISINKKIPYYGGGSEIKKFFGISTEVSLPIRNY